MFGRIFSLLAALSCLSACTYWQRVPLTGKTHPSGWADQIRERGVEAYPYAQMSFNAYGVDNYRYDLGPEYRNVENRDNDEIGFAYSLFERRRDGRVAEVIIAFRGTELHNSNDILLGSALARQNPRGLALYDEVKARAAYASARITVTGHSLGGGIAIHVSLQREGVNAYAFNTSPRFSRRSTRIPDNRRLSIAERGEFLKIFRIPGREAPQTYVSINCVPGFGPVDQHGSRLLADCLTRIAAWQNDPGALASMERNTIEWPAGRRPDR